jgi:hypothetical protein
MQDLEEKNATCVSQCVQGLNSLSKTSATCEVVEQMGTQISSLREDLNQVAIMADAEGAVRGSQQVQTAVTEGLTLVVEDLQRRFDDLHQDFKGSQQAQQERDEQLTMDLSSLQGDLTQSVKDVERTSSAGVKQCVQDLSALAEALQAEVQSEIARIQSRASDGSDLDVPRLPDMQHVQEIVDSRVDAIGKEWAERYELIAFKHEDEIIRIESTVSSAVEQRIQDVASAWSMELERLTACLEALGQAVPAGLAEDTSAILGRLQDVENTLGQTIPSELDHLVARLGAFEQQEVNGAVRVAADMQDLMGDVAAISGRLQAAESALQRQLASTSAESALHRLKSVEASVKSAPSGSQGEIPAQPLANPERQASKEATERFAAPGVRMANRAVCLPGISNVSEKPGKPVHRRPPPEDFATLQSLGHTDLSSPTFQSGPGVNLSFFQEQGYIAAETDGQASSPRAATNDA